MLEIALSGEEDWPTGIDWQALAERAAQAALAETPYAGLATSPVPAEISIHLTSDEEVHGLNRDYRDKDKPTNVLSFPMLEEEELSAASDAVGELLLGDIVLARGVCEREAAERNIAVATHATHLIVHGTLHLLGYDHMMADEADAMEAIEIRALARLGIANPYADATGEE